MKRFTASDGLSLAFRDEGTGPALVCLPGLTRNGLDFGPVAERFAGAARVVRLDLRGRGASGHAPDFRSYNVLIEARDVVELLDHLGLAQAAILGTSRGGQVAMVLGQLVPDRLTGVALNDIGPVVTPGGLDRIRGYLGLPPSLPTLDALAAATAAEMADTFPGVSAARWRAFLANSLDETPEGLALRYDPALRQAMEAALAEHGLPDLWQLFDGLPDVPLLLLHGANSDILSAETADEMARRRPHMERVTLPDRGHIPFLDEPAAVAALERFVERLPSA